MKTEMTSVVRRSARHGLGVGLIVLLSGCASPIDLLTSKPSAQSGATGVTTQTNTCETPRPRICTMEYKPVCAVMASGLIRTYPSACNACADVSVNEWRPEPCEE
ncbi:hypothetical protein OAR53_02685 [Luminiphilus sp.]|nr:hypothetical protein [Luminiphilus sp.]MDB2585728.1 hypothetical protein [Luminiphilus sp.]MDB2659174.1 hypothetical protein [Luminiphilus sp.]MDC0973221.1 hypothetical protein [Luminiphilus sp.]